MMSLVVFTRTRSPGSTTFKVPDLSVSGKSVLATHTTVLGAIFLYQMPTYRFLELDGLKKPNSKVPADEIKVVPLSVNK